MRSILKKARVISLMLGLVLALASLSAVPAYAATSKKSGKTTGRKTESKESVKQEKDKKKTDIDALAKYKDGFYGIWTNAVKEPGPAINEAKKLNKKGYDSYVCYSPEWANLNSKPFYCVTAGRYASKKEAEADLEGVKKAGYEGAYVKFSGERKYVTISYLSDGNIKMDVSENEAVLKDVEFEIARSWYPQMENEEQLKADFIIDKDTVFDETCDTAFFENYKKGDTPLKWFKRNYDLMQKNSGETMALFGVFEVGVNGDHIDRFFGSYWWD